MEMARIDEAITAPSRVSRPKWSWHTDPNIPELFKARLKRQLGRKGFRKKFDLFWDAIHTPTSASDSDLDSAYSVKLNVACQFLELVYQRHGQNLGPPTKGEVWDKVCSCHLRIRDSSSLPTNRARVFNQLGLSSLPKNPPGRKK